ncbi:VOC family protein [Sphingosinicella sp.]|uniref:VOC family protein n=1 Tax=Sphingosinicella sp. TaxID=1917971 RepID=UPI0040381181
MPLNPIHIAQIAVPVRDLDRARAFYRDTLGLPHLFDAPPGLAFFQCGETRLMLSQPEGPESAGSSILYYAVSSARAAEAGLAGEGVTFDAAAHCIARIADKDVWLAVARDSEGNLIGLMSEEAAD